VENWGLARSIAFCAAKSATLTWGWITLERDSIKARWHDSIRRDWSASPEPVPYAKLNNPQSLNLYAYALNNPTTLADPDGHDLGADPSGVGEGDDGQGDADGFLKDPQQKQTQQQNNSQNQPNQPPASWDKTKPLPEDPSKLGPDWKKNPD
jgi:hypothetical protein